MAISMKKAIAEKCKDCIYDPLSGLGTWVQQVTGCTSPDCALFPFRPLSKTSEEYKERKAEWSERNPNHISKRAGFKTSFSVRSTDDY